MSLVNIMFRSNRTFRFSQNQTTYSVAFSVAAWLVIVEGFVKTHDSDSRYQHCFTLKLILQRRPANQLVNFEITDQ